MGDSEMLRYGVCGCIFLIVCVATQPRAAADSRASESHPSARVSSSVYVLDVRLLRQDGQVYSYVIGTNGALSKEYDAVIRYPTAFSDNGSPVQWAEEGSGYCIGVTNLVVDQGTAEFSCSIINVEFEGWDLIKARNDRGIILLPMFGRIAYQGSLVCEMARWVEVPVGPCDQGGAEASKQMTKFGVRVRETEDATLAASGADNEGDSGSGAGN